jgi:hypothetical protein
VPAIPGGIFCDGFSHGGRNEAAVEFRALRAVVPRSRHRIERIGSHLLKRQVDNVHGNVLESETGQACETSRKRAKAKWGPIPVSVRGWVSRASAPCFLGVRVKAKRNGCFSRRHWESLAPRPPEDGYKQEGPVHYQWVRRCNILGGDGFSERSPTKCRFLLTLRQS